MSQVPQTRQLTPQEAFNQSLKAQESQLKTILPPHIPVEKFIRIVMTAVIKTPKLLDANRTSLFLACNEAAKDGLIPDGKESALIPFYSKETGQTTVTYMPMITGILKKIRNSGELNSINSYEINKNDQFDYFIDEKGPHLMHKPNFMDPGEFVGAYTLALTKDGGLYLEVMSKSQIEAIRLRSRSKDSGPWKTDYSEMGKKTVTKRIAKRLPSSTDIESYFKDEDDFEAITEATPAVSLTAPPGSQGTLPAPEVQKPVTPGPSKLKGAIQAKKAEIVPPAISSAQPEQQSGPSVNASTNPPPREEPPPMDFNDEDIPI